MASPEIAEEPVKIAEEPVKIAEEPVTIAEEPVTIAEPVEERATAELDSAAAETEPAPKRKSGRPVGSKSKEPGKPRAPRAKKVVVEERAELEPEPPKLERALPNSLPIPEEAYDLRTAKMLRLLAMQSNERKQQKRNMYSSWFR